MPPRKKSTKSAPPVEPGSRLGRKGLDVWKWKDYAQPSPHRFKEYLDAYMTTPLVHQAVQAQVDHAMSEGYELEPANDQWDTDVRLQKKIRDCFLGLSLYGNLYIEVITAPSPWSDVYPGLRTVAPWHMKPHPRDGRIIGYDNEQSFKAPEDEPDYTSKQIVMLQADVPDDSYWGVGDVEPCMLDITRKKAMESQEFNIHRQFAHPAAVVSPSAEIKRVDSATLASIVEDLEKMADEESHIIGFEVPMNLEIFGKGREMPDFSWLMEHVDTQIVIGMGMPPVLLGLPAGSTEATAKVETSGLNRRIKAKQFIIKEVFDNHILNRLNPPSTLEWPELSEPVFNVPSMKQGGGSGESGGQKPTPNEQKPS